ncbi:MAG: zinc ribbon domain-containing protein [Gemmatimonadaceae bacterium]
MFKSLRVPERLFSITMWAVSLVFAYFLTMLGSKFVGELPGVDQTVTLESHIPPADLAQVRAARRTLDAKRETINSQENLVGPRLTAAGNVYRAARESFDTWISTRTATTDPKQDPEVLRRQRNIDSLKIGEAAVQAELDALNSQQAETQQSFDSLNMRTEALQEAARPAYERELFVKELTVFGIRLLITLPLLLVAVWLVIKKRKGDYWPLARGFILFALFAFFFELVPYLPSYGGFVRNGVGVVLSVLAGVYAIRAMRRYLATRQAVEQQSATERQRTLGYEDAIRKMNVGVCPGCERPIAGGVQSPSNFCVHCGIHLFDNCPACSARKNAFFQYCPTCGVTTEAKVNAGVLTVNPVIATG